MDELMLCLDDQTSTKERGTTKVWWYYLTLSQTLYFFAFNLLPLHHVTVGYFT